MMESARDQGAGFAEFIGRTFLTEDPDGVHCLGIWNFRDEPDVVSNGAVRHRGNSKWDAVAACLRGQPGAWAGAEMSSGVHSITRRKTSGGQRRRVSLSGSDPVFGMMGFSEGDREPER